MSFHTILPQEHASRCSFGGMKKAMIRWTPLTRLLFNLLKAGTVALKYQSRQLREKTNDKKIGKPSTCSNRQRTVQANIKYIWCIWKPYPVQAHNTAVIAKPFPAINCCFSWRRSIMIKFIPTAKCCFHRLAQNIKVTSEMSPIYWICDFIQSYPSSSRFTHYGARRFSTRCHILR